MHHVTDDRPALLLSMGPGTAERLLAERHRDGLAALTRTDPHLVAHDLAAPGPGRRGLARRRRGAADLLRRAVAHR